mmetsp:Transcript_41718/g.56872  ORF Transcript_41718/g.56872 Transcript_41718/m.56872 type:complete len:96 (+) Transcript_41718:42-329(+)
MALILMTLYRSRCDRRWWLSMFMIVSGLDRLQILTYGEEEAIMEPIVIAIATTTTARVPSCGHGKMNKEQRPVRVFLNGVSEYTQLWVQMNEGTS